jgi:hypothetical protein
LLDLAPDLVAARRREAVGRVGSGRFRPASTSPGEPAEIRKREPSFPIGREPKI